MFRSIIENEGRLQLSRQGSVLRSTARMDFLPCEHVPTRHLHILPAISDAQMRNLRTAELDGWLREVELRHPLDANSTAQARLAPPPGLYEVPPGMMSGNGPILLRIGRSQVYGEENSNYQIVIRLGGDAAISCPTGKYMKNVELREDLCVEVHFCFVENAIEQRVQAKFRSLKDRASGIFRLRANSRTSTNTATTTGEDDENDGPMVRIPLATLFHANQNREVAGLSHQMSATYFVTIDGQPNSTALGEVSISLLASPTAIVRKSGSGDELSPLNGFQNYLTIRRDDQCWRRWWTVLVGMKLYMGNFQRHDRPGGVRPIDLQRMVAVRYISEATDIGGLQHVVRVTLEDGTEILTCADSEQLGISWADAIHRAVWNQPYPHHQIRNPIAMN